MKRASETEGEGDPKRCKNIEHASDRAYHHREAGNQRVGLNKIGFWQLNRGGQGVDGHHVHEVAFDIISNSTKYSRYLEVALMKIPAEKLEEVRQYNRQLSEDDHFLPQCGSNIQFVCLTKTHFCHAHMLVREKCRTVYNQGTLKIAYRPDDSEGPKIIEEGPICAIYGQKLWDDPEAAKALASDDNLNANVQMGEDELQAFGRVCRIIQDVGDGQTAQTILTRCEAQGLGNFSSPQWFNFIHLGAALPSSFADMMTACIQTSCAGRVRVSSADYGLAAKLDVRSHWSKIAILIHQYISNVSDSAFLVNSHSTFAGRDIAKAKNIKTEVGTELVTESAFVNEVHWFIHKLLKTYKKDLKDVPATGGRSPQSQEKLARADFLSACGKYILNVGGKINEAVKRANLTNATVSPQQRQKIVAEETKLGFNKLEAELRKKLVEKKIYEADTFLPTAIYPMPRRTTNDQTTNAQTAEDSLCTESRIDEILLNRGKDGSKMTEADVFDRLNIDFLGGIVMGYICIDQEPPVDIESSNPDATDEGRKEEDAKEEDAKEDAKEEDAKEEDAKEEDAKEKDAKEKDAKEDAKEEDAKPLAIPEEDEQHAKNDTKEHVKTEEGHGPVKLERADDVHGLQEVKECNAQETLGTQPSSDHKDGSQPRSVHKDEQPETGKFAWYPVWLLQLDLTTEPPQAEIGVPKKKAIPKEKGNQADKEKESESEDWITQAIKDMVEMEDEDTAMKDHVERSLWLPTDKLMPVPKAKSSKKETPLHPTLQPVGARLCEQYTFDDAPLQYEKLFVQHMLWHCYLRTQQEIEGLQVSLQSKEDKHPITLQARALRCFKKGELTLMPALGEVVGRDDAAEVKKCDKAKGKVDSLHVNPVSCKMHTLQRSRPGQRKPVEDCRVRLEMAPTEFYIYSQLQERGKVILEATHKVNPFWAMLRAIGPKANHNMELEQVVLRDLAVDMKSMDFAKSRDLGKHPKTGPVDFTHEFAIARNVKDIEIGEVLILPHNADAEQH